MRYLFYLYSIYVLLNSSLYFILPEKQTSSKFDCMLCLILSCWKGCLISFQAPHSPTFKQQHKYIGAAKTHPLISLYITCEASHPHSPNMLHSFDYFFTDMFDCEYQHQSHAPPTNSNRTPPNQYIDPMVVYQSHLFISL